MESKKTIAIPPGATIREQLLQRGMSQKDFAIRMDMSEKHISNLINGKVELTHDTAIRLESVLGVPAQFWSNMESIYREQEARVREENELEGDVTIAKMMPYAECARLGWFVATRDNQEKVFELRRFFEVARLKTIEGLKLPGIAYRVASANSKSMYTQAIWAQKARLMSRSAHTGPTNIEKLKKKLTEIRVLTTKSPEEFYDDLVSTLSSCGIALVVLQHIKGSFLHGATFYEGNRIVLALTVRGKDADKFWFSLFHELGHIVLGHISQTSVDESAEKKADEFARNALVPPDKYAAFVERGQFSEEDIQYFAKMIGIAPGIVLGRLQNENYVPYDRFHRLKVQYELVAE